METVKKMMVFNTFSFRTFIKFIIDVLLVIGAYIFSFLIRFEFQIPVNEQILIYQSLPIVLLSVLISMITFRVYKGLWEYASIRDLITLFMSVTWGWLVFVLLIYLLHFHSTPRSVLIIYWFLSLLLLGGVRFSYRIFTEIKSVPWGNVQKVLIIGAGKAGEMIIRQMRNEPSLGYYPSSLVDDDPSKLGIRIHGVTVDGTLRDLPEIVARKQIDQIIIAAPSAKPADMRRIVAGCEAVKVEFKTVPGPKELVNGDVSLSQIRKVRIEDLLDREPVATDFNEIRSFIMDKVVLVTGAAGSIGSELCRQLLQLNPKKLICFDRTENSLFHLEKDLMLMTNSDQFEICVADILDYDKSREIFNQTRPDVVFHAAAYKHVPLMELHPEEAIRNNVFGTLNMITLAEEYQAKKFVLISTDKAVNPTSMMGASKRLAELVVQSYAARLRKKTSYSLITVRFGNVLGSMGSAVPLFQNQIAKGGPVTVTHPDMKRFFMTIPEAVKLILEAAKMGDGGEIFVLDMGEPIRILDFARHLIQLSGFEPETDIPITFIGVRPGEKMEEELWNEYETPQKTAHKKIMMAKGNHLLEWEKLRGELENLRLYIRLLDRDSIYRKLKQLIPEYEPFHLGNGKNNHSSLNSKNLSETHINHIH